MSLEAALLSSRYGITKTQNQLNIASANIANADREGYTRKSYLETGYVSVNGTTVAYNTTIERASNRFLSDAVMRESSQLGYANVAASYLDRYDTALGSTSGQSTISAALNELVDSLNLVAQTPESTGEKISAVQAADDLAYQLNRVSADIQQLRQDADQEIAVVVERINSLITEIDEMNTAIINARAKDIPSADLEDRRATLLEDLSQLMDIQFHETDQGRIQIYSNSGQLVLGSQPQLLSFTPSSFVGSASLYPDSLSAVMLGTTDMTLRINGGELGALIDIRDTILVQEQAALDELATELMEDMNRIHNDGASVPGPNILTGGDGFAGADSLAGSTGIMRIAAIDANGNVIEALDIDMSVPGNINNFIAAIDGMANLSATLTVDGEIEITAPGTNVGIAITETTPVNMLGGGQDIGAYFQFNNFFDTESTNASNIRVRSSLLENPEHLSTGTLTSAALPIVNTVGVAEGDSTNIDTMVSAFTNARMFDAAGSMTNQSVTFQDYASIFTTTAAIRIETAANTQESAQYEYDTAKNAYDNFTGVNVDEELTNVTVIENAYAANAQVMSTVRDMFERLLQAIA